MKFCSLFVFGIFGVFPVAGPCAWNPLPQHVTKLCFASVRMCDCKRLSAHDFVDFCLQTTPTTSEVLRCRSPSRCPLSSLTCQTLCRRDVVQSPFTVAELDLSEGDDHRCCRKLQGSLRSFSLTGTIF